MTRGDTLGHDGAAGIAADVDHLGAGVGLLLAACDRDGIKFAHRIVTAQDAAGVFPGDGRTGLHLGPGNMRTVTAAVAALGDEIVDTATTLLVAGIPVLDRGILDACILHGDQLDHRGMQLVFITHGRGTAFQVADVTAGFGDDQRTLELAGVGLVDAEIGRQLHRATHARRNVDKGPVRKHRGIETGEVVIGVRHHRTEILLYQFGILAHGLRYGTENHAGLGQVLAKRGCHRHAVEHGIHGHARQRLLLFQRNAQLVVGIQQLRIDFVETLRSRALAPRRGIIGDRLEIDRRMTDIRPLRLGQGQPVAVGLEPRLQQPFRLLLA